MGGRSLAEVYRRFGEVDAATSRLYQRIALEVSRSAQALRVIETAPARRRQPATILAALHYLALDGRAPALARAYDDADHESAATAAINTLVSDAEAVVEVVRQHGVRAEETVRGGVLYPAIAAAAHTLGAQAVGLIDVGSAVGFNLNVDRVGVTYDNGQTLGDLASVVQVTAAVVGDRRIPTREIPEVTTRINLSRDCVAVTDADQVRWLRACVGPEDSHRRARLEAELGLAQDSPPDLVIGDAADSMADAVARVPSDALPMVLTTWTLARLRPEDRQRFVHSLQTDRPVAWISVEGVGVAPTMPTLGDRDASGHSIIGMAIFDGAQSRTTAFGRCWSRGAMLSWLTDQP